MIDLPNVTLWACCWSGDELIRAQTLRVIRYCRSIFNFGDVLFFSSTDTASVMDGVRTIKISGVRNMKDWNVFVNAEVPKHISSGFAMSVHEDGFPLDPSLWSPNFLKYDYIGAPWNDRVVGNGGFNIESERLLKLKMKLPPNSGNIPSDYYVCRVWRRKLERAGIKFAPWQVAVEFSTETFRPSARSFGFHGKRNRDKYLLGWNAIANFEKRDNPRVLCLSLPIEPSDPPRSVHKIPPTDVIVVYAYPPHAGNQYPGFAKRFVDSYHKRPPGYPHRTVIVINGDTIKDEYREMFSSLPDVTFIEHDDSGWDIGAYQLAARSFDCDLMLFLSGSAYFNRSDWLADYVLAFRSFGPGIYGAMGNRGDLKVRVWRHIRTVAFAMPPSLLNRYPKVITQHAQRHPFEHGPENLTVWVLGQKLPALVVTKSGTYRWANWDDDPQGFHRGSQSALLIGDHICEPPYHRNRK